MKNGTTKFLIFSMEQKAEVHLVWYLQNYYSVIMCTQGWAICVSMYVAVPFNGFVYVGGLKYECMSYCFAKYIC